MKVSLRQAAPQGCDARGSDTFIEFYGGRSTTPAYGSASASDSVVSDGTKLSLRGLLHYLWDQAKLTRWHPGFAGKRSWATVRGHLLHAAENKIARGGALDARLYIPEVFSVGQRDVINARRVAQWAHAVAAPGMPQHLMLLIAEVKEITPSRYGFKVIIKHLPDQAFAINEKLYRRLGRRFESELSLWGAAGNLHMVMIATFGISTTGLPAVAELSLMPVTSQWVPIEDGFEQQLIERLARDGRSFVKGLRYNLPREQPVTTAVLTDIGDSPVALWVTLRDSADEPRDFAIQGVEADSPPVWVWRAAKESMPPLPPQLRQIGTAQPVR